MDIAMIYYMFYDDVPYTSMLYPIIPNIALVRSYQPDLPIHVIDVSRQALQWSHWQDTLNFTVHHRPADLSYWGGHPISTNLQKPRIIRDLCRSLPHKRFMFCDTDILWLKDPVDVQFSVRGVCAYPINSGMFLWDAESIQAKEFFRLWIDYTNRSFKDQALLKAIRDVYYGVDLSDEAFFVYVYANHPGVGFSLGERWNFVPRPMHYTTTPDTHNVHLMHGIFGPRRGLAFLVLYEFYKRIKTVLSEEQMEEIFGAGNMHRACSMRLVDFLQKVFTGNTGFLGVIPKKVYVGDPKPILGNTPGFGPAIVPPIPAPRT